MKQAPEAGYQKNVTLGSNLFQKMLDGETRLPFFFKIKGRYGKGIIRIMLPFELSKDGGKFILNGRIWLQSDGSRNLESGIDLW